MNTTLLELLYFGLPALFITTLGGGLLFVGFRARTAAQGTRWAGYVFIAAFVVLFLFALFSAYVAD